MDEWCKIVILMFHFKMLNWRWKSKQ